ncbi:MAG: hypothetical protein DWQ05_04925 [Calditrichaeota bacterium]|nr:MAG: hypothetical protein DWQ05_04925 [Calditrichota bacterium]
MKSKLEKYSKVIPFFVWSLLFLNSACSRVSEFPSVSLQTHRSFSGISLENEGNPAILSDILFTEKGDLATLERDSGRVSIFQDGAEKQTFIYQISDSKPAVAVAMNECRGIFSVLDLQTSSLFHWRSNGRLLALKSIIPPATSQHITFAKNGDFYSSSEGVGDKNFILHYNEKGLLQDTVGTKTSPVIISHDKQNLAKQLAQGQVPDAFADSVLLAANSSNRLYILYRNKPVLQCFQDGILQFEKILHFPELARIKEAISVRNNLISVENHYIPMSYWNDFILTDDGEIYILLALQNRPVIYKLDQNGNVQHRFLGATGKGHLLAVASGKIAIADAISGKVTLYKI